MLLTRFFREDIYTFQGKDYIGALQSVSIKRDNRGSAPDWYLEKVNDWANPKSTSSCYKQQMRSYIFLAEHACSQGTASEVWKKIQTKRAWG